MVIYLIINKLNLKEYVGQTVGTAEQRWYSHTSLALRKNKPGTCALSNAIRKYGKDVFAIKVLCACDSIEELNEKEIYHISVRNSATPNGYNIDSGGKNRRLHPDTKAKLSKAKTGKRGTPCSEENKQKLAQRNRDRIWTDESKAKSAAHRIGQVYGPPSAETKQKLSNAHDKDKVKVLCIENNTVYESVKDAARKLSLNKCHIFGVLAGRRNHHKGYTFKKV
jgi:group I intron endonuclease